MSRRGSISLLLCIVITVLSLIFSAWVTAAQARRVEAELVRALSSQIECSLAGYDRPLLDQFGLLGFKSDALNEQVFNQLAPSLKETVRMETVAGKPLFDSEQLDSQMVRQMKTRLPLVWINTIQQRMSQLQDFFSTILRTRENTLSSATGQSTGQIIELSPGILTGGMSSGIQVKDGKSSHSYVSSMFESIFASIDQEAVGDAIDSLTGPLLESLGQNILDEITELYDRFKIDYLAVSDDHLLTDLLGTVPDFFNPDSMTQIAGFLDRLLDAPAHPIYEKLCVSEYVLSYLTSRVNCLEMDSSVQLTTPDGRMMTEISVQRPCEVEQVMTGLYDHQSAALLVRTLLTTLRGVIQLAAILTDTAEMGIIRATAAAITGAIAAASCGSVVIEPETMTYIIAAGKALIAGFRDTANLIAGKGVRIWPGIGEITIECWYPDYLRLILYLIPRAVLVRNSARIIQRVSGASFHTELVLRACLNNRCYVHSGGYG